MNTMPPPVQPVSPGEAPAQAADAFVPKRRTAAPSGESRVAVRASERDTFTEYHVTATIENGLGTADDLFGQVAAVLASRKIQPIQEKLYGRTAARSEMLRRRSAAYRRHGLDADVPVSWIEGIPLEKGDFAGLQIWGIAPRSGENCVRTTENPATGPGRVWTGRGFQMLYLPSVRGTLSGEILPAGHTAQAHQMFTNVGLGLRAHGLAFPDVVRTWIYVSRLLDWYGEFNRVRTAHYTQAGLGTKGGPAFPASTGIQGRMAGEECLVDVLALRNEGPSGMVAESIRSSPRQDQSFHYGSAFSRGMTFSIEGRKTVHISGTASINTAGASTHLGDAECQSMETLMSIAAILETQGGSLHNITSATLFCKDPAAWAAWKRVTRLLQVPAFPRVCLQADVCRHDLLVEMEAVAVI